MSPKKDKNSSGPAKATDKTSDEDILKVARRRFDLAVDAESESRRDQLDDLEFRSGKQWPDDIKTQRQQDKRPCLTINRLPQFVNQIINDQRQNRPSIKVNPVDEGASLETAKVFQGLIRHIEYNSNADVAYDRAFESSVVGGLGYFRVVTDYCNANSFDQEIFLKSVPDRMSVYVDPHYKEPDGSDMDWGFFFEEMSKDEFTSIFPDADLSKMDDWVSIGDKAPKWIYKDSVKVAEYFYKSFKEIEIHQLSDGSVVPDDELEAALAQPQAQAPQDPSQPPQPQAPPLTVVNSRKTIVPAIKWCKINGLEILDRRDWAGQWVPIIPVQGSELIVDGKRIFEGIVRHAKDPQRMLNYWATTETETIALAPKAPFIGAKGQFEGFERQWKELNQKPQAYVEYNEKTLGGQPVGPPTRTAYEPPVQAISQARAQASDDLKATTGIYDATLGNRSNEQSGIAIQRRNAQAQTSNYHYVDNLSRALRHAGRIMIDLIPHIYDTPRIGRIIGEDGSAELVPLNRKYTQNGKEIYHDLDAGTYDVTVTTGPSFSTRRQESVATMLDFIKVVPKAGPLIGDLIARDMDSPGAEQIADRLKQALPPGINPDDKKGQQIPPAAQQTLTQQHNLIGQLTQQLGVLTDEMKAKKYDIDSKERIEMSKIQSNVEIALAELGAKSAQVELMHQVTTIKHRLDRLDMNQPENGIDPGSGAQGALPPGQVSQPATGGNQSPGQPMGV